MNRCKPKIMEGFLNSFKIVKNKSKEKKYAKYRQNKNSNCTR